jgi:hypothetical protein
VLGDVLRFSNVLAPFIGGQRWETRLNVGVTPGWHDTKSEEAFDFAS